MTTLITRLYADDETAAQASDTLVKKGFSESSIRTIDGDANIARLAMVEADIDDAAADAYADSMAGGGTLLVLRAPFGTVGTAVTALDKFDAVAVDTAQETYLRPADDPSISGQSIIPGNKKFLTARGEIGHSTMTGERSNLISDRQRGKAKVGHSTKMGARHKLISRRQKGKAKVSHKTMTGKRWNLIKKPRSGTAIVNNPTPFSSLLGWPTIIRDY